MERAGIRYVFSGILWPVGEAIHGWGGQAPALAACLGSIFYASAMAVGMLPSPLRASFLPPCLDHFAVPKVPLIPDPTSCPSLTPPRVLVQEEARAKRTDLSI